MNSKEIDLARSLFDELPIQKIRRDNYEKGLIYHINDHIHTLELEQEPGALKAFETRLRKDPEGTVEAFKKLREVMYIDYLLARNLDLSKKLFGEAMLINSLCIGHIYVKKRDELQAIEEPIVISQALKVFKSKIAENSEQVVKDYNELLSLLSYLRNPLYYGTPERPDVCLQVNSLSKKIYDKEIDHEILFKIAENIK